jgi:hypothetical protein
MKKSMLFLAALTLALLVLSYNRQAQTSATEEENITTMIATAKTPEDHMKIAQYYEDQATMMEKTAALHESMAKAYMQRGKMPGMSSHCEKLVKESKASAAQYKDMAEAHKKMAQQMQSRNSQKPQ